MSTAASPTCFHDQHERLDAQLHAHLLDIVGADFFSALQRVQQWYGALQAHIAIENTLLLPHIPAGARWDERVYRLEHERIELLAQEHIARMQAVVAAAAPAQSPHQPHASQRETVLMLLDGVHALRHVLEHHHAREEQALAAQLPSALQYAAFAAHTDTPRAAPSTT